jgi:hypothetical protein
MRQGFYDKSFVFDKDVFVGINLGWDFCSEHEWGIKKLKETFRITDKGLGFVARKISKCSERLTFYNIGDSAYLTCGKYSSVSADNVENVGMLGDIDIDLGLDCSWDEGSFNVFVKGERNIMLLRELYDAFQERDVVIFLGGNENPFSGSGLKLCIYSRIPENALRTAEESDKDYNGLLAAVKETGIEDRLKVAQDSDSRSFNKKCSYYALVPKWLKENTDRKTKYRMMFWLNPCEQRENNYGWFTVEELDQWIVGEGPIKKVKGE